MRITLAAVPPARAPDSCGLYHGPVPAGTRPEGHPAKIAAAKSRTSDSAGWIFAFKPQDNDSGKTGAQLGLGFHYVIGLCADGKTTPEAPLWVASRQAPSIVSPKAQETSPSPTLSWSPVPGVPAYHLLLSDQAIDIDVAKGTVSGASIIWQAITTQASIAYGTPDPSGNFSRVPAPPLSPGVPYNLVILNNYDGRSALATSTKAQGLKLFTVQPPGPALLPPRNLSPGPGLVLSVPGDSVVPFRWTRSRSASGSAAANTYQLFVYSLEQQGGLDVLIPIWSTEVTDTSARLDGRRVLLSRRYVWKVFALSDAGAGTVGDTTSFLYRNDVQTLSVKVRSAADAQPLGDVRIAIAAADGGADPLPLFTAKDGFAEKVLAAGSYALAFSKDGFLAQSRAVDLGTAAPLSLQISLAPASGRIAGRMADKSGADLANVEVTAAGGGRIATARSDAQGYFLLGVSPGTYSVSFAKPDYQPRPDTTVTVNANDALDLGKLVLAQAQSALTGAVSNDKGVPLPGCDVAVKAASGALARSLRTDDKGAFSAFLPPGTYAVTAARAGFTSETRTVQLAEAAHLAFTLASGASLVKGRISLLTRPAPGESRTSPLPGAAVELIDRLRGTLVRTEADLRGEFSFSADTGTYLARASAPGKGLPDSALLRVAAQRSTYGLDLSVRGFASVSGTIHVTPDTALDPASVAVTLLNAATLAVAARAVPQAAPAPGEAGAMAYSLDGVPDGSYRLACGLPGYGLDVEPAVTVRDGVWKTGQDLTLKKASKTLTFAFAAGGKDVKGTVGLITPLSAQVAAGARFGPTSAGTYTLDALPDSLDLIPLSHYGFPLPAAGAADTTVALAFPFAHHPAPLSFTDGQAGVTLESQARIDSLQLIYGYGEPADTLRVPASQLFGPPGPRVVKFRPGPQGGRLTYWFRIKSGGLLYSNADPARRFRAEVEPSRELAFLKLAAGDSLRLPARTRGHLYLHAYDAAGRRLDSLVDARGGIRWQADSALAMKLDKRSKRALAYLTAEPTSREGRAAAKRGAAKGGAAARWDTLRVTVELDGIRKSLALPTRVVEAVPNKLVLTSTLGEVNRIGAPEPFGLFVSAYDTTLTPPVPVVADPVFSLDPPEAGTVAEMRVDLDPRFIGPLRVFARQTNADGSTAETELGAARDSSARGLNVGQTLRAGDSARLFFHDRRCELRVPDSAFADKPRASLRLFRRTVAKSFANGLDYAVDGPLWEISNPSGAAFAKPPRLFLGLPPGGRAHAFKRFDALKLEWKNPADSAAADTNSFGATALSAGLADLDGNYYGLWGSSRPLTAGEVRVIPNPFSPLVLASRDGNTQYGTRIRVEPESDRSAEVTLTLKIYTLDGELLRTLVDHKTVPKGPADFYWDGKADGGRWARNGRYLLEVAVNATGSSRTRYTLKPVVVFR